MRIDSQRVYLCLAERSMTQKQLAELCGVPRTNISTILGRGTCTAATLGKIARGLGVPVEEIAGSSGARKEVMN